MKVRGTWLGILAAFACTSPTTKPQPPTTGATAVGPKAARLPLAVRATAKVAAPCGPDSIERHATSLADLDGNGVVDRPSITRSDALVVKLYEMPTMIEAGSWELSPADGYVEIATPKRRDESRGDLWITVGAQGKKPWSGATAPWTETLYHLEAGELVAVTTGYRDMRIRVDVDGDGRVDPIGSGGGAVRALLADGRWLELPIALSSRVHGLPTANGQQEAVDLDGNGIRELIIERDDAIAIVEVPSLRETWSAKGQPWKPTLLRWAGEIVLAVRLDKKLRVYKTDSSHALIAEYPNAQSFAEFVTALGSQLVMRGHPWSFFSRARPAKSVGTIRALVERLDDKQAPYGPTRFKAGEAPGLLAVNHPPLGKSQLWIVDPETRSRKRALWESEQRLDSVSNGVNPSLVDLDRDGTSELLLEHVTHTFYHHGGTWNTSRLELIEGTGRPLWKEAETRTEEWVHEGEGFGKMRQTRFDGTRVRAFDLGDGTTPLRVRSLHDEYYLLPSASKLDVIPPCLE